MMYSKYGDRGCECASCNPWIMAEVLLKFVCTGDGSHREKALPNVLYQVHYDGNESIQPWVAEQLRREVHPKDWQPLSKDNVPKVYHNEANQESYRAHFRAEHGEDINDLSNPSYRLVLKCPRCRPHSTVLNGENVKLMCRHFRRKGKSVSTKFPVSGLVTWQHGLL